MSRRPGGRALLRSNIPDWSAEDLWRTYMQLTEAEAAFRIHKSDLSLRPIVRPDPAQAALLDRLGLELPQRLRVPPPLTQTAAV